MADLLTHVLVAYVLATALSWRYERITPALVVVAMAGATTPDLSRLDLLVPGEVVTEAIGVPWDWMALHTLGGTAVVAALAALSVPRDLRKPVVAMLLLGAASHHALDLVLSNASGHTYPVLWPATQYHPPTPGLYLSTDRLPAVLAVPVAGLVALLDRRRDRVR